MTKEEYKQEEENIKKESTKKLFALKEKYAIENNPYKVGDVISDSNSTIIIDQIQVWPTSLDYPSCIYIGKKLTKKGTISKRQDYTKIFQCNVIRRV